MAMRPPTRQRALGALTIGAAATAALGLHVRVVRPRLLSWGATREEFTRPMVGDEVCARPQFNATRAVTIRARPQDVWPWLMQLGFGRAGWYSYDLLDNLGRHSAERIMPEFQQLAVGDRVPMGGTITPYTANRVTRMEPNRLMLWQKGGGPAPRSARAGAVPARPGHHQSPVRRSGARRAGTGLFRRTNMQTMTTKAIGGGRAV